MTAVADCDTGTLRLHVNGAELATRRETGQAPGPDEWVGAGRELFAGLRAAVGPADEGASVFAGRRR